MDVCLFCDARSPGRTGAAVGGADEPLPPVGHADQLGRHDRAPRPAAVPSRGPAGAHDRPAAAERRRLGGAGSRPGPAPGLRTVLRHRPGAPQPGCITFEPAFALDAEWCLLDALSRLGRPDGSSTYLRLSTRP